MDRLQTRIDRDIRKKEPAHRPAPVPPSAAPVAPPAVATAPPVVQTTPAPVPKDEELEQLLAEMLRPAPSRDRVGEAAVPSFALLYRQAAPSVVDVVPRNHDPGPALRMLGGEPEWRGSGFVVRRDRGDEGDVGWVLTNQHLVGDSERIDLRLPDGRELTAELVGRDAPTDIALLKIVGEGPPAAAQPRRRGRVSEGDWVLAVGSPFGLSQTVTKGVVSKVGRKGQGAKAGNAAGHLQIDAPLNPGARAAR